MSEVEIVAWKGGPCINGSQDFAQAFARKYGTECSPLVYKADFDAQRLRADTAEAELAQLKARYGFLRKVTPYRFKKMQDEASTDGGDVIYFHADKFDAQVDAALNPNPEAESHEAD